MTDDLTVGTVPSEAGVAAISLRGTYRNGKRVLLVDARSARRDVRAEMLRKLGIEVDSASDIHEARIYWRPNYYDLVLLHVENQLAGRDTFCTLMRSASPASQFRFLWASPSILRVCRMTMRRATFQPRE